MSKYFLEALLFSKARFWGLLGQIMAFAAMMLPIVSQNFESLGFLLITSAIANFLVIPGSMVCGHIIPSLKSVKRVSIAIQTALLVALSIVFLLSVSALVVDLYGREHYASILFLSAIFTFVQVVYLLSLSIMVRERNERNIFSLRFRYGFLLLTATVIAIFFKNDGIGLTFAYIFATIIAALSLKEKSGKFLIVRLFGQLKSFGWFNICLVYRYICRSLSLVLGSMISTAAFHITTMSINNSGPLKPIWAVTLRIVGGAGTTASQLIAPSYEGLFAEHLRCNKYDEAWSTFAEASKLGLGVGVATCLAVALGGYWVTYVSGSERNLIFVIAAFIFSMSIGFGAIVSKFPGLCGAGSAYMYIAAIKIVFAIVFFVCFENIYLILSLVILELFYQILIFFIIKTKLMDLKNAF